MLTRRKCLHLLAAAGAFSLVPSLQLSAAPGDKRLVVIILRGGIDGLDTIRPTGDPDFAALRPGVGDSIALDGFFGMHPSLGQLEKLYRNRELSFVHAVATPYRQRSHFDGQDVLERGIDRNESSTSGWLNRLLGLVGGKPSYAIDIGNDIILDGPNQHQNWFPEVKVNLPGDSAQFLQALYKGDPILEPAFAEALRLAQSDADMANLDPGISLRELARLAAKFLNEEARIAVFSVPGWDTHIAQKPRLSAQLSRLSGMLLQLKESLANNWQNTTIAMCSEFGRTARFNGTGGTDHGTGGIAILAGGLLANGKGGQILVNKWPGLGDDRLYESRDLLATADVRLYLGWLITPLFGVNPDKIASTVFPGVDMQSDLRLL